MSLVTFVSVNINGRLGARQCRHSAISLKKLQFLKNAIMSSLVYLLIMHKTSSVMGYRDVPVILLETITGHFPMPGGSSR